AHGHAAGGGCDDAREDELPAEQHQMSRSIGAALRAGETERLLPPVGLPPPAQELLVRSGSGSFRAGWRAAPRGREGGPRRTLAREKNSRKPAAHRISRLCSRCI